MSEMHRCEHRVATQTTSWCVDIDNASVSVLLEQGMKTLWPLATGTETHKSMFSSLLEDGVIIL